ncbi:hypothetical protein [Embleya scabrispora]|uniref:hypothetical protein n=1 Tax=Embleya scabrispora TaxID=159449 RepID=UPI0003615D46|nr:hypothetical protein [Embleya scabrispora]
MGTAEEREYIAFDVAVGDASLRAGDEWPQFVDRLGGLSASAGDLGEADGGVSEPEHHGEVDVSRIGHARTCGGMPRWTATRRRDSTSEMVRRWFSSVEMNVFS